MHRSRSESHNISSSHYQHLLLPCSIVINAIVWNPFRRSFLSVGIARQRWFDSIQQEIHEILFIRTHIMGGYASIAATIGALRTVRICVQHQDA